jgi:hypothetical protein
LSRNLDGDSTCEAGVVSKTLGGQVAQGLHEITLMEEFAKMNEITDSIMLSLGFQARVSFRNLVDSLEGTMVWEYEPMACPKMIVQL